MLCFSVSSFIALTSPTPASEIGRAQVVDVAKRREIGRAVAGDRDGAREPGYGRVGIVTRPLLKALAVDSLHDHERHPDALDLDAPERAPVADPPALGAREVGD